MNENRKRRNTRTRDFGSSKREGHDSSSFYNSALYQNLDQVEDEKLARKLPVNEVPFDVIDQIICGDSRRMNELPDNCVHLMVTSPPYNVGKQYDDNLSLEEYLELLHAVFAETYRVLVPGGRACINVANVGRRPYLPLHAYIVSIMLDLGFLMRGEIIWNKSASSGTSTAWGSWMSASNPTLRDVHEYILVFSKLTFGRKADGRSATISRDEFLELTKSIWEFQAESARKVGHPAPFPIQLPYNLIQLYTFADDVVLDPFCGSGTTCLAAKITGRRYVGYDIDPKYVELARMRVESDLGL